MNLFSTGVGLLAFIGAAAVWRWAFGGDSDRRPAVDLIMERVRERGLGVDRQGAEGAANVLYPASGYRECPSCKRLHRGAHGFHGNAKGVASGPVCGGELAAKDGDGAKVLPIRRAS